MARLTPLWELPEAYMTVAYTNMVILRFMGVVGALRLPDGTGDVAPVCGVDMMRMCVTT